MNTTLDILRKEWERILSEIAEIEAFEAKHGSVSRAMQTRFNYLYEMAASFSDVVYHLAKESKS